MSDINEFDILEVRDTIIYSSSKLINTKLINSIVSDSSITIINDAINTICANLFCGKIFIENLVALNVIGIFNTYISGDDKFNIIIYTGNGSVWISSWKRIADEIKFYESIRTNAWNRRMHAII